jgi:hypothetical protein
MTKEWTIVGIDTATALRARSIIKSFIERVIEKINTMGVGEGSDDPELLTAELFWGTIQIPETRQKLNSTLRELHRHHQRPMGAGPRRTAGAELHRSPHGQSC